MLRFFTKIVAINVIAYTVLFILGYFVPLFATTHAIDTLFFGVILMWIVAGLLWDGGKYNHNNPIPGSKEDKAFKMVKGHDVKSDKQLNDRYSVQTGMMFFFASLPAFIGCIILLVI